MDLCSQGLPGLCELGAYVPNLSKEEFLSFMLGTMIVVFFAIDHYRIPTYAKTTIGDFIELAPESLTSAKRYRKGLYIYISLMFGLYLAFCFFWSQGLVAILATSGLKDASGIKVDSAQLWPMAAATAVTLIGTAGDKTLFGRMEAALRSIAHEAAYIPEAVIGLSNALNGNFAITIQMAQEVGETSPALLAQIAESQDGSVQTWIRARYLFSRLEFLRNDTEFQPLLNRPEHVRAFDFLNEERQNLAERVAQRLGAKRANPNEPLRKRVENFRSAVSVFLASVLWQGCGSEISIQRKLTTLKLLIKPVDRHFSWNFTVRVLASLAAAAVLTYVVWYLFDWQWNGYLANDSWHFILAVLIFFMTALFATKRREARFIAGRTDKTFDAALASALYCGFPIGFVAAVTTFAWNQGGQTRFWIMLWTGLSLSVFTALLFEIVMRWAAQSPPTLSALRRLSGSILSAGQDLRWVLGRAVLLYAAVSFVTVFVLFWVGEAVIAKRAPKEAMDAAERYLTQLTNYSPKSEEGQNPFEESLRVVSFKGLLGKVNDAQAKVDKNKVEDATIADIVRECDVINQSLSEKVRNQVLLPSCGLNSEVTRGLGEGAWLDDFRNAMLRVEIVVTSLKQFQNYATATRAIGTDWPRALVVAILWAFLSAVFSASIFLCRRSVLWETINAKTLNEYTSYLAATPESWLRTPIDELDNLTPLEAIRYQDLRASLSDYLRANKQQSPPQLRVAV